MRKRLTLIANKQPKKSGRIAMAILIALTSILSLSVAAANSGMFDFVFEGDTSYLAKFIKTPKHSVSDDNYTLTVEQYLVTDNSAMIIYSIEALNKKSILELNNVDEKGRETFFSQGTLSFSPTKAANVKFDGFTNVKINGDFNTLEKKYYRITATTIENPEHVSFQLGIRKMNGVSKIIIPMTPNIQTTVSKFGNVTIEYNPISLQVMQPNNKLNFEDSTCLLNGEYYLYFRMKDNSIKTLSQLYEEYSGDIVIDEKGTECNMITYVSKEVIEPDEISNVIVYRIEYDVGNTKKFDIVEKSSQCIEYSLNGKAKNNCILPNELKPFTMTPYIKNTTKIFIPLKEFCEQIGADLNCNKDTLSAKIKYRGKEYIILNDIPYFSEKDDVVTISDNDIFIDEYGRLVIPVNILSYMDIEYHGIARDSESDISSMMLHILP